VAHWKSMMERDYLYAFDLQGKDVTLTIEKVTGGQLTGTGGKKTKKPLCYFRESQSGKPLALNSTNCKTIASLYGNDTDQWVGKRITIFPTTTQFGGDEVECIRVRPRLPPEKGAKGAPEPPPQREPGEEG
jgi:hypothetical protein